MAGGIEATAHMMRLHPASFQVQRNGIILFHALMPSHATIQHEIKKVPQIAALLDTASALLINRPDAVLKVDQIRAMLAGCDFAMSC